MYHAWITPTSSLVKVSGQGYRTANPKSKDAEENVDQQINIAAALDENDYGRNADRQHEEKGVSTTHCCRTLNDR